MGENSESLKAKAGRAPVDGVAPDPSSCRKKKSEVNEGFVKDMMAHMDEFVHASFDEHKSCLNKTVRKLFGVTKAVQTSAATPPPVVSVLPLRVTTSDEKPCQH